MIDTIALWTAVYIVMLAAFTGYVSSSAGSRSFSTRRS